MDGQNELLKQTVLPNSSGILVMGIMSIVCICCGPAMLVGFVLGILAVVMGSKAKKEYDANPEMYTLSSYKNVKSGRICGIIGICLSSAWVLFVIILYMFVGCAVTAGILQETGLVNLLQSL